MKRVANRIFTSGIFTSVLLGGLTLLSACDQKHDAAPPQPTTKAAAVLPPTTVPASQPVAEIRIPSTIVINGQPFSFPPAKLVLKQTDNGVRATLFSDDPPEALKEDYTGNSFYFDVTIEADSLDDLVGQQFVYRNSMGERRNSTTGIFIDGSKQVLQPLMAAIEFDKVDGQWVALIGGQFQMYDEQTPDNQAISVKVQGRLTPHVMPAAK